MMNRIIVVVILVPLAILLIALAVANRIWVPFTFDPFNASNPALTIELPLFLYILLAIAFGVVIGGITTWMRQGRYRRIAKERAKEIERLQSQLMHINTDVAAVQSQQG